MVCPNPRSPQKRAEGPACPGGHTLRSFGGREAPGAGFVRSGAACANTPVRFRRNPPDRAAQRALIRVEPGKGIGRRRRSLGRLPKAARRARRERLPAPRAKTRSGASESKSRSVAKWLGPPRKGQALTLSKGQMLPAFGINQGAPGFRPPGA